MDSTQPERSNPQKPIGPFALLSRPAVLCLVLSLAIVAVYWPVRHFEFLNYDDPDYVTANPQVLRGLTVDGVIWAVTTRHADNWHPLTWMSHMLDVDAFGPGATGPHLVNLFLHAINTILVFLVLLRFTGAYWRCATVAALFGLHPLHVESVAWISERKDVLSTFFAMLALWFYARYAQCGEAGSRKPEVRSQDSRSGSDFRPPASGFRLRDYCLSLIFFTLGLLSKSMLVTLPFVMLLLDDWPLRRSAKWEARGAREEANDRQWSLVSGHWHKAAVWRRLVVEKMPFFLLSSLSSLVTYFAQRSRGAVVPLAGLPLGARIENALVSYARYVGKMFWPSPLVVPYPHPGHWTWEWVTCGGAVTISACVLAITLRRRWPFLFTGWFWFFGTLIPVIGLVQVGHQSLADRYTYFPLIGLFIAGIWGAAALASWARLPAAATASVAVLVLVACAARTVVQLSYWQSSGMLFRHALACSDGNYLAHDYLGGYLEAQGKGDEAIREFQAALSLNSHDALSYAHLGVCHFTQGDLAEAERDYNRALELDPQDATTWINLGALRARQGRIADAKEDFQKALELEPDSSDARARLAEALCAEQRYGEAISNYESALRLRPADARLWNRLGNALFHEKRYSDAIQCYQAGLRLNPDSVELLSNLGAVQFELGKLGEALQNYTRALEIDPSNAQAHNNLANVLFRENRLDEAAREYQRALEINPQLVEALNNLGWLRLQTEDYPGAHDCFIRAYQLRPGDASIQLRLALVLERMGRVAEALQSCQQALRLNPNSAEAHFELASLLARLGRSEEARRQVEEALRIRPDYDDARKLLNSLAGSDATPK